MNAPSGRSPRVRSSVSRANFALGLGLLAIATAGDREPQQHMAPCRLSGVVVQVFAGSRLFEAPGDRLELVAGRPLDCASSPVRQVLAALERAVDALDETSCEECAAPLEARLGAARGAAFDGVERTRFVAPLRVHLDPRLPSRQAPLAGIEVHVGRRELLVARSVLDDLGPEVWRHELLHTLAAPPPEGPSPTRRLWLTLEEALVAHIEQASAPARESPPPNAAAGSKLDGLRAAPLALPAAALLADPAYDPHPLAAGLARELARAEIAVPPAAWMDCLAALPLEQPAGAAAADVFRAFFARCSAAPANELSSAIARWWVEAEPAAALASARNAAAQRGDSR